MRYRVVKKADGSYVPQKGWLCFWKSCTYFCGDGPSMAECYRVYDTLEKAWAFVDEVISGKQDRAKFRKTVEKLYR